jgi:hypothetical protein
MSNPTTNFLVGGIDLSSIFQPYSSGARATATEYKVGGQDLNTIFAPYNSSLKKAIVTGYTTVNGSDLNEVFAKKDPFTTTGTVEVDYQSNYYIITFKSSGSITFVSSINDVSNASIICVAGGGGGGAGICLFQNLNPSFYAGRGGGGGGNYQISNVNLTNIKYTVNVGLGGLGGQDYNSSYQGRPGTMSEVKTSSATIISCSGGGGGGSGGQTINIPGLGGNVTTPSSTTNGGGGGGGSNGVPGDNSYSFTNNFDIPVAISGYNYVESKYCGGGGSPLGGQPSNSGGSAGSDGKGGPTQNSSTNKNGQTATTPGSGGGGAGANEQNVSYKGGNGANGIVIFYFEY